MPHPQTPAPDKVFQGGLPSNWQDDAPLIPAILQTQDIRTSGFLKPTRRGFAAVASTAPAVGAVATTFTALFEVPRNTSLKVYGFTVVLFDALAFP